MLIEKAKIFAISLEVPIDEIQFSHGWLQKFKERNGIRQLHGESASANSVAIAIALPLLHLKCAEYPPELIYNRDETGLFYRLEPDKTLASRRLSGRKKNKERISITLCVNADGSHKLDPLIIGKYAKPRCFKNVNISNLPMTYRNNGKAWMITTIFQEWLEQLDRQVRLKHGNAKALLLLDNCASHKSASLQLQNIEIQFLPPNTTSKIQPMDAGIIMSFKQRYRRRHIRWMLEQVEAGLRAEGLKMDILQAIRYIICAWGEVSAGTIRNCWRHTGIVSPAVSADSTENASQSQDVVDDLNEALQLLSLPDPMQLEDFLNNPEETIIDEALSDDQIVSAVIEIFKEPDEPSVDEQDDSSEIPVVGIGAATKSLETLRVFLLQQEGANEELKSLELIKEFLIDTCKRFTATRQTTLDQFLFASK